MGKRFCPIWNDLNLGTGRLRGSSVSKNEKQFCWQRLPSNFRRVFCDKKINSYRECFGSVALTFLSMWHRKQRTMAWFLFIGTMVQQLISEAVFSIEAVVPSSIRRRCLVRRRELHQECILFKGHDFYLRFFRQCNWSCNNYFMEQFRWMDCSAFFRKFTNLWIRFNSHLQCLYLNVSEYSITSRLTPSFYFEGLEFFLCCLQDDNDRQFWAKNEIGFYWF